MKKKEKKKGNQNRSGVAKNSICLKWLRKNSWQRQKQISILKKSQELDKVKSRRNSRTAWCHLKQTTSPGRGRECMYLHTTLQTANRWLHQEPLLTRETMSPEALHTPNQRWCWKDSPRTLTLTIVYKWGPGHTDANSKSAHLLGDFQSFEVYQEFKTRYSVL